MRVLVSHLMLFWVYGKETHLTRPPILRLRPQEFQNEILRIVANVLPVALVEDDAAGGALVDQVRQVLGAEGRVAAQERVRDDAQGPHVDGLAVALLQHHLRRRVPERPGHGGQHLVGA